MLRGVQLVLTTTNKDSESQIVMPQVVVLVDHIKGDLQKVSGAHPKHDTCVNWLDSQPRSIMTMA